MEPSDYDTVFLHPTPCHFQQTQRQKRMYSYYTSNVPIYFQSFVSLPMIEHPNCLLFCNRFIHFLYTTRIHSFIDSFIHTYAFYLLGSLFLFLWLLWHSTTASIALDIIHGRIQSNKVRKGETIAITFLHNGIVSGIDH